MMATVLTTHSRPLLCGCVVIMPPVNWQGRHLGGGTASTDTKKTSVGWAASASTGLASCSPTSAANSNPTWA